jgi:hypothetical protein
MKSKLVFLSALVLAVITPASVFAAKPVERTLLVNIDVVSRSGVAQLTLSVYTDGFSILAQRDAEHPGGEICERTATLDDLLTLRGTLRRVRALGLPGTALPPNRARITVNFFEMTDRRGHTTGNTFGYSTLDEPYDTIDDELTRFIGAAFDDCE